MSTSSDRDVVALLQGHRSIRKFTDSPVSDAMVEDIIGAGLSAATSSNLQGTTVIRIREPETRARIAEVAGGQAYIESAAAFFVWCADLHRSATACEMHGGTFSSGMTEHFLIATVDCALAAQNAVVAAESLGLGICYIGAIRNDPQVVADLLELPDHVYPVFGLCIGWPDQDPMLKPRLPLSVTLKEERYDDSTDADGIAEYDSQMREYYRERTNGKLDREWSADMEALLGKESRPHIREFLAKRGFEMR
ncbi:MAG: oxygen-insensitive NADPH nitroreductase [Actinomycetota bacterium]